MKFLLYGILYAATIVSRVIILPLHTGRCVYYRSFLECIYVSGHVFCYT